MKLADILFLDIETVSEFSSIDQMDDLRSQHWYRKCMTLSKEDTVKPELAEELYNQKAGIFAEFAKVVCISVGFIHEKKGKKAIRLKSFCGDDEKSLLDDFSKLLNEKFNKIDRHKLCGHNIKEFDIPFLSRRMIVNRIPLPKLLDLSGKKPWELNHLIDTMELWKFGDYKNFTSLALLANVLGIANPKDDIDGSMVGSVYWIEKNLTRIVTYCEKDVRTVANIYLIMNNMDDVKDEISDIASD